MTKSKIQNKSKSQISNTKTRVLVFVILILNLFCALNFDICHFSFAQEKISYDAGNRRDPFISLVTPDGRWLNLEPGGMSGLRLEGITFDEKGNSYAIINSQIVEEGDRLGDFTIQEIETDKVILLKNNEIIEIKLEKEEE